MVRMKSGYHIIVSVVKHIMLYALQFSEACLCFWIEIQPCLLVKKFLTMIKSHRYNGIFPY